MIPVLFSGDSTNFNTNGIGRLTDAISCYVTEERNGPYELQLKIATTTPFYEDIKVGNIIVAQPYKNGTPQAFEIYSITKPINQKVTVSATHISYRLSYIPVKPFSARGITNALNGLKTNSMIDNPFNFYTDFTNEETTYNQIFPKSLRSCLGGTEGSILDTYASSGAGEYLWDNFNVSFLLHRGSDKGIELRYGKNVTDIEQEEDSTDLITGVLPYWTNDEQTIVYYGDIQYVDDIDPDLNIDSDRIKIIDLSYEFDETPTASDLNAYAKNYINSTTYTKLDTGISISFVDLSDYGIDINLLESINLCDTVHVIYDPLDISYDAQVVKTKWDVLNDKYDSIQIGQNKSNMGQTLTDNLSDISEYIIGKRLVSVTQKIDRELGTITSTVAAVEETIDGVRQEVSEIEQTTASITSTVTSVQTRVTGLEDNLNDLESSINELGETIDSIEIGTRNLLYDTDRETLTRQTALYNRYFSDSNRAEYIKCNITPILDSPYDSLKNGAEFEILSVPTSKIHRLLCFYTSPDISLQIGETYTISFWAKLVSGSTNDIRLQFMYGNSPYKSYFNEAANLSSIWKRFSFTFEAEAAYFNENGKTRIYAGGIEIGPSSVIGTVIQLCAFMLEKGTYPSDWKEAPEDTNNTISEVTDILQTQITQTDEYIQNQAEKITTIEQSYVDSNGVEQIIATKNFVNNTTFTQTANELTTSINRTQETITEQGKTLDTLTTVIRQTTNGIEIGKSNSDINAVYGNADLQFNDRSGNTLAMVSATEGLVGVEVQIGDTKTASKRWRIMISSDSSHLRFTRHT